MQCPKCHHDNTKVVDSRPTEEGSAIRRRRACLACDYRFTTFERVEQPPLLVIKRDGNRQEFSREKLLRGMVRSCEKRPVALEDLKRLVSEIESELRARPHDEVSSQDIGEMVMDRLPAIDEVAYIRYASVYRRFEDPTIFLEEIESLRQLQRKQVEGQQNLDLDGDTD